MNEILELGKLLPKAQQCRLYIQNKLSLLCHICMMDSPLTLQITAFSCFSSLILAILNMCMFLSFTLYAVE